MSLRKSPTLTPALTASNRRNARKSTGPRTARGKAWSRLNRLRNGSRSPECTNFLEALLDAPPGRVGVTAQALLQSNKVLYSLFIEAAELSVQAEIDICEESRRNRAQRKCENDLFLRSKPESY
jgi:hypothetical protein